MPPEISTVSPELRDIEKLVDWYERQEAECKESLESAITGIWRDSVGYRGMLLI